MKRKLFLAISSILLFSSLFLLVTSFIVTKKTSAYNFDYNEKIKYVTLTKENEEIISVSSEEGNKYSLALFDKSGNNIWKTPIPSYATMLKSVGENIIVGVGTNLMIFNQEGENKLDLPISYGTINDVILKDNTLIIASSRNNIDNKISVFDVDNNLNVNKKGEIKIKNSVVQLGYHNNTIYYGTGSKVCKLDTSSSTFVSKNIAVPSNNHLGIYLSENGTLYVSTNNGNLEIMKPVGDTFSTIEKINFGVSGSLIFSNDNGYVVSYDYQGNALIYDTNEEKTISITKIDTSVSTASLSNSNMLLTYRIDKGIDFFDVSKIKTLSFFQNARKWFAISTIIFALMEVCSILYTCSKTHDNFVHVLQNLNRSKVCYLYLLPVFALLAVFNFYPVISGFSLAFQDYFPGVRSDFVGLDNFKAVFTDKSFWSGTGNMFIFLAADLFKAVFCSLLVAEIIISINSKTSQYWARFLMYLPGILPGIATWLIWQEGILGANGVLTQLMGRAGVVKWTDYNFLGNAETAKWALIFVGFPWLGSYLIVYGALRSVPDSIYDAAKLDGFSWIKKIVYIDMPLIYPQLKYLFLVNFISSIQNFSRVYITTNGAFDTQIPALSLYQQITTHQNYGVAAAMGVVLFFFIFGFSIMNLKSKLKEEF